MITPGSAVTFLGALRKNIVIRITYVYGERGEGSVLGYPVAETDGRITRLNSYAKKPREMSGNPKFTVLKMESLATPCLKLASTLE